ncbi:MAG: polysaccharide pyruvyl transferase family protein [Synergistaceae bacterium]|nr:polysaccharide pyruvyl transferase family protein [Synergistaceae bacterium]
MRRYRAAVLGYYGFGNLGDELLLRACLEMFRRCGLRREDVVVLSASPEDACSVNRWKFREVVRALRESDTLLLGGGGLFQDTTSVKSCVWYWGIVRLAKLLVCRVWALGQSVGPLKSRVSRMLAGDALRLCEAVHVRDEKSYSLAKSLGCRNVIRGHDLVLSLPADVQPHAAACTLVNLRPCADLDTFTRIIAPNLKGRVVGVALSDEDIDAMKGLSLTEIVRVRSFSEAADVWSKASCAVGMRLHFGVLSRIFRTPLAMMPYDPKVSEFASQSGVPCITDEWCEPVMPRPVPECSGEIDALCREMLGL